MADRFVIRSTRPDVVLSLQRAGGRGYVAEVRAPGLVAAAPVAHLADDRLHAFLAALASDWRAWSEARQWRSREGTLTLEARTDGDGRVQLHVRIVYGIAARWSVETDLELEPGELDTLARAASDFARRLGAVADRG